MKNLWRSVGGAGVFIIVSCLGCSGHGGSTGSSAPTAPSPSPAPAGLALLQCDGTLWEHTYSKSRFTVFSVCSVETVTVTASNYSNDGDLDADATDASGKYVAIEIPCQRPPATSEVLTAHVCDGVIPSVAPNALVPGVYDVAGPNVWDNRHNWREIHGAVVRLRTATTALYVSSNQRCRVCEADDE